MRDILSAGPRIVGSATNEKIIPELLGWPPVAPTYNPSDAANFAIWSANQANQVAISGSAIFAVSKNFTLTGTSGSTPSATPGHTELWRLPNIPFLLLGGVIYISSVGVGGTAPVGGTVRVGYGLSYHTAVAVMTSVDYLGKKEIDKDDYGWASTVWTPANYTGALSAYSPNPGSAPVSGDSYSKSGPIDRRNYGPNVEINNDGVAVFGKMPRLIQKSGPGPGDPFDCISIDGDYYGDPGLSYSISGAVLLYGLALPPNFLGGSSM